MAAKRYLSEPGSETIQTPCVPINANFLKIKGEKNVKQ